MKRARLSSRARRDLLEATRWIAADNPTAARALREAVDNALLQIGAHRHCGTVRPEIIEAPYRFIALTGFPYLLVYSPDLEPPLILRLLHGARHLPGILGR
jgi:toxin ParE1/3/4